jgi:hypothetical protein
MEAYMVLKNLIIGFSCLIVFCKFMEKPKWNIRLCFSSIAIVILVFIHNTLLSVGIFELYTTPGLLVVINLLIFKPLKMRFENSLIPLTLSYAAGLLLYFVCSTSTSLVFAFLSEYITGYLNHNIAYFTAILQIMISLIIHLIRFNFTIHNIKSFRGVCCFIFGTMLIIYSLMRITQNQDSHYLFVLSLGLISYGLFIILKRETLQAYHDNALRHKLNEISARFNNLMQTNDFLTDRIHKDVKYLRAFHHAITIMIQQSSDDDAKARAQGLLDDITEFKIATQTDTQKYYNETRYEISGVVLLDSILIYMLELAKEKGVELNFDFQEEPFNITRFVSHEQLSTLIADLLENSIIAVENSTHMNKKISCAICKDDISDTYQIIVKDSGVAFDRNILKNIGKKKVTTYKNAGGSGIGLWNVYKTMRSSKASLIINEFLNELDFTKAVIFRFDGRCEYKYVYAERML